MLLKPSLSWPLVYCNLNRQWFGTWLHLGRQKHNGISPPPNLPHTLKMYGWDFVCSTDSKKRTSICPLDLWRPRDETQFWHVDYLRGQSYFDLWREIVTSNLLTYLLTYFLSLFSTVFFSWGQILWFFWQNFEKFLGKKISCVISNNFAYIWEFSPNFW